MSRKMKYAAATLAVGLVPIVGMLRGGPPPEPPTPKPVRINAPNPAPMWGDGQDLRKCPEAVPHEVCRQLLARQG